MSSDINLCCASAQALVLVDVLLCMQAVAYKSLPELCMSGQDVRENMQGISMLTVLYLYEIICSHSGLNIDGHTC